MDWIELALTRLYDRVWRWKASLSQRAQARSGSSPRHCPRRTWSRLMAHLATLSIGPAFGLVVFEIGLQCFAPRPQGRRRLEAAPGRPGDPV